MPAGFIYFAVLGSGRIKVGRFAESGSIQKKESEYRRLDPKFKIRHAYWTADAAKEEKRVLSSLRLVGGTDVVKGAGRETFKLPVEHAIRLTSTSAESRRLRAVNLILECKVEPGKTVESLINEMSANFDGVGSVELAVRNLTISDTLLDIGVWVVLADADQELSVNVYATVIYPDKLLKAIPALKPYSDLLRRLPVAR